MQENLELRQSNFESTRNNGRAVRRLAARRFDLHYIICVLTTSIEDEHVLLWRTMVTLVRHTLFPPELLDEELRLLDPPLSGRIPEGDDVQKPLSFWSAFNVPPRPSFSYIITVPVEMEPAIDVPLVLTRTARYRNIQDIQGVEEVYRQIGGVVRDRQGTPLAGVKVTLVGRAVEHITDEEGHFVLRGVPSGPLQLHVLRDGGEVQVVAFTIPVALAGEEATNQLSYTIVLESGTAPGPSTN